MNYLKNRLLYLYKGPKSILLSVICIKRISLNIQSVRGQQNTNETKQNKTKQKQ